MKNITRAIIAVLMVAVLSACMTGCYSFYTFDELGDKARYEEQAKINAVEYIKEKYGFEPKVLSAECPKVFVRLDAHPSSQVSVKLKYDKKTFYASISGYEATTEGVDNYQLEDIKNALKQKLIDITDISIEELFVCYGRSLDDDRMGDKNGLISCYYNGDNLSEIFGDWYVEAVVSVIEQDISKFQADQLKTQTGIDKALFINYDSKEHYDRIKNPHYDLIKYYTEQKLREALVYINEFRIIEDTSDQYYISEDTSDKYYCCPKAEYDGIIAVAIDECETISIEKTDMDSANNWSDKGFKHPIKTCGAYSINTDAKTIQIFIPITGAIMLNPDFTDIAIQYANEYETLRTKTTDDYKYLTATLESDDNEDIKVTAMIDFWDLFL